MLKEYSGEARSVIHRMVNKVWEEEMMSNKWRIRLVSPLHKKGDTSDLKQRITMSDSTKEIIAIKTDLTQYKWKN